MSDKEENKAEVISQLVSKYKREYRTLTNEEILDIRSDLSIALFDLVNSKYFEDLMNDAIRKDLLYEKNRADTFKRAFEENGSTAARELFKSDPDYLNSKWHKEIAEKKVKIVNKIVSQAKEVLNSIASRVR